MPTPNAEWMSGRACTASNFSFHFLEGAVFVTGSVVTTEHGVTFTGNTAVNGAGGGMYCSVSVASFNKSVFMANNAVWGGGGH